jgi:hypothetical protein
MAIDSGLSSVATLPGTGGGDVPDIGPGRYTAPPAGTTLDSVRPPAYGRGIFVSVGAAAAVFALAIVASGGSAESTGVPLTETTTPLYWGLSVIVIALVGVGAHFAEISADRAAIALGQPSRPRRLPTAWALPAVAVATALLMVATYHNRVMLIGGPAIAFFGVSGALLARDLLDDVTDLTQRTAATIHAVIIHSIAFLALSAIYLNKMSAWAGAPLVAVLSGILMLEALGRGDIADEARVVYAASGGLAMALGLIALNWWPTHGWIGGASLLICFFTYCGVLVGNSGGRQMSGRDLGAYLLFSLVGLAILGIAV